MTPIAIVCHHSAVSRDVNPKQFKAIDNYHKGLWHARSSLGFYGGYHYLIEPDGEVKQYRKENEQGIHAKGWNDKSIGVCLSGNFQKEEPTEAQLKALFKLLDKIISRHGMTEEDVFGHKEKTIFTHCPGKYFLPHIRDYREQEPLASKAELAIEEIKKILKKYEL